MKKCREMGGLKEGMRGDGVGMVGLVYWLEKGVKSGRERELWIEEKV